MPISVDQPSSIAVSSSNGGTINVSVVSVAETKVVSLTSTAENNISVAGAIGAGPAGPQGPAGADGAQGPQGETGPAGETGQGIAAGGDQYQVLVKASDTDYDTEWANVAVTQRVKNVSGGELQKGTPIHAVTYATPQGQLAYVIAARADTPSSMPATFILNETLADEAEGQAIVVGLIKNVDTSAFTAGDVVYVGETGGYTNVKPTGTNLIQNLGVVIKSDSTSGSGMVYGSGRSNDVPNLPEGKFFIGSSTNTTESAYTLPTSDGTSGQALTTDGSGALSFSDIGDQTLDEAINVFLPDGGNFGKFSHTDTIEVGDGTKTAIDIIREALSQLGNISAPSINVTPNNVGFSDTAITDATAQIQASVTNPNTSQGSTITFKFYKKIGSGSFTLIHTETGVTGSSASYTHSELYSFAFSTENPTNEHITWKVSAEDPDNGQGEVFSSEVVYNPVYTPPRLLNASNGNGISLQRVTNATATVSSDEDDANRQLYNGESNLKFKVEVETIGVGLDSYAVLDENDNLVGSVTDISSEALDSNDRTGLFTINIDDGDVAIGDSNTYKVKIWDNVRPYSTLSSTHCDFETASYTVNRVPVKMIMSSTTLTSSSSDADFQNMYDGVTSNNGISSYPELITSTGDLVDGNTSQLNVSMLVPNTQAVNDFVYVFVPSYYFSDGAGGYQDLTGGGNLNQDFFEDYGGNNYVQRIEEPPQTTGDFWLLKEGLDLQVQFGTASNKIPFHVLRLYTALANVGLRGTYYLLRNTEA